MRTNSIIVLIGFIFIFLVFCVCVYFAILGLDKFSEDPEIWAHFGSYIGGVIGSTISIMTLIVTIWLTLLVNQFTKENTENQIRAERKIAQIQIKHEALKELKRILKKQLYNVSYATSDGPIKDYRESLESFFEYYSYLFDFEKNEEYEKLIQDTKSLESILSSGDDGTIAMTYKMKLKVLQSGFLENLEKEVLK